jgi:hypothetical protein
MRRLAIAAEAAFRQANGGTGLTQLTHDSSGEAPSWGIHAP